MDRRSGRNGHHYERCTLAVVTNLIVAYADDEKAVRLVVGVQLHGSSGARSSRLLMRGSRVQSGNCSGGVRLSSGDGMRAGESRRFGNGGERLRERGTRTSEGGRAGRRGSAHSEYPCLLRVHR